MLFGGIRAVWCAVGLAIGVVGSIPSTVLAEEGIGSSGRHVLWQVQSQHNTAYVLGSIHVLQAQHYPLAQELYDSFEQTSTVMFEVDLHALKSPTAQLSMLKKGLLSPGQKLQDLLSEESYHIVKQDMAELGMNIEVFQQMKPWLAATALTAMELQKLGFDSEYGVDRHFFQKAQEAGKSIVGLETVEFQLSLFENLSPAMQESFLLQTLTDLKSLQEYIQQLVDAWLSGDSEKLEAILQSMQEYPELYEALVVQRNRNWLTKIETALQDQEPVMIIVGTLHVLGQDGLIALLQEKGYTIRQL